MPTATTAKRQTVEMPAQVRALASIRPQSINLEQRTFEAVWTTGARVLRYDWWENRYFWEELGLDDGEVRMDRLNTGAAPFQAMHRMQELGDQIGVVERVWWEGVGADRVGVALVRLSKRESVTDIWQDIVDGILRSLSVGYFVYGVRVLELSVEGVDVWRVVDWEPYELSLVSAPADIGALVRDNPDLPAPPVSAMSQTPDPYRVVADHRRSAGAVKTPCVIDRAAAQENPMKDQQSAAGPEAMAAERVRTRGIIEAGRAAGAPNAAVDAAIEDGITIEEAKTRFASHAEAQASASERAAAVAEERRRVMTVQRQGRALGVQDSFIESLIAEGRSLEDSLSALVEEQKAATTRAAEQEKRAAAQPPISGTSPGHMEMGAEESQKRYGAMQEYILYRANPTVFKMTDGAREFRGCSMLDLVRFDLESRGINTRGMSRSALAREGLRRRSEGRFAPGRVASRGVHVAGDFPELLGGTVEKVVLRGYNEMTSPWRLISTPVPVSDLNAKKLVRLGDMPDLEDIEEGGEYTEGTIGESAETLAVTKAGVLVSVTEEILINDQMGVFGRIPLGLGQSAARNASVKAMRLFANGTTLTMATDGRAVFNATDGNLITGAGNAPDLDGLQAARKAMRGMLKANGKTTGIVPKFVLIPDTYEATVDQYIGADNRDRNPADPADRVPQYLKNMDYWVDMELTAASTAAWYVVADPAEQESIGHATLEGEDEISIIEVEKANVDALSWRVRHWINFGWIDRRGAVRVNNA